MKRILIFMVTAAVMMTAGCAQEPVDNPPVNEGLEEEIQISAEDAAPVSDNTWGISLSAKNVSPIGLTLVITQSGGEPTGELNYGSDYQLTVLKDGAWTDVPYVIDGDVGWTSEAYIVQMENSAELEISWEWLYGNLNAGTYRITKSFMDFRGTGDYDDQSLYAEFTIE